MITAYEKHIYNTFLGTSRTRQNLPYKNRKDFAAFEDDEKYVYVKKLSALFNNYKHIDIDDFFSAPYEVYPDDSSFDLRFYTTQKAIKTYTLYKQKQENADPDSSEQTKRTLDSIYFIYRFCIYNNLRLDQYLKHKTGAVNDFMIHLKEGKINLYSLFNLKEFDSIVQSCEADLVNFMLPDLFTKIGKFRLKFYSSKKLKKVCTDGLEFIERSLPASN